MGTSFVVAFIGFLPLLKSLGVQNLQKSGKYLNTLSAASFEVVSFAGENAVVNPDLGVPVLDIYTDKKLFYDYFTYNYDISSYKSFWSCFA